MGVRPEENHAIGVEFVSNPAADIKDRFHGDHLDILTCTAGVINAVTMSRPGQFRTDDQGIMRTKAHSGQVIRKYQTFSGFARASVGIRTKPDNVKTVSESFANRLVLPVMGSTHVGEAQQLVEDHLQEIIDAWDKHFPN